MTNGSCHSKCESNVHTWLNPCVSAWRASSTVREAGGFVCSTTPKSMGDPSVGGLLQEVLLQEVLRQTTRHVLAVALAAAIARLVDHDLAPRHHDVHVPVDLIALPRGVV